MVSRILPRLRRELSTASPTSQACGNPIPAGEPNCRPSEQTWYSRQSGSTLGLSLRMACLFALGLATFGLLARRTTVRTAQTENVSLWVYLWTTRTDPRGKSFRFRD